MTRLVCRSSGRLTGRKMHRLLSRLGGRLHRWY